jgi:hypothetical protein
MDDHHLQPLEMRIPGIIKSIYTISKRFKGSKRFALSAAPFPFPKRSAQHSIAVNKAKNGVCNSHISGIPAMGNP